VIVDSKVCSIKSDRNSEPDEYAQIMLKYKSGNADDIDIITKKFSKPVYNMCYFACLKYLKSSTSAAIAAEDLSQHVWLKLIKGAHNYKASSKFSYYLMSIITKRLILDWIKKYLKHQESEDTPMNEEGEKDNDPIETHMTREPTHDLTIIVLKKCISDLSSQNKDIIEIYYNKEFTYREITSKTGIALGSIGDRLTEILKELKNCLASSGIQRQEIVEFLANRQTTLFHDAVAVGKSNKE